MRLVLIAAQPDPWISQSTRSVIASPQPDPWISQSTRSFIASPQPDPWISQSTRNGGKPKHCQIDTDNTPVLTPVLIITGKSKDTKPTLLQPH